MITNNIKAILFTSLIVAMILPLSIMDNAYAQEKVVDSLTIPNAERDLKLDAGYKLYPGGWISPEQMRDAPTPVYVDHPNDPDLPQVLDVDAMLKQMEAPKTQIKNTSIEGVLTEFWNSMYIPLVDAYISYQTIQKFDSGNDMTYQRAYWNVPTSPSTYNSGTNFDFNAVQPTIPSSIIFQPMLQHGYSSHCDAGNAWVTYPFILVGGVPFGGSCVSANEGDLIRGILSEGANNLWTVSMKNYNNPAATSQLQVVYSGQMDAAFTAVENWNIPTNCTELQGDVEYKYMSDTGDVVAWSSVNAGTQFCGMSTNIVSDSKVQFNNNN